MKPVYLLIIACAFVAGCKDNNDATPAVSNEEAADMIASSIASSSGGLTLVVDDAVLTTSANGSARTQACGYTDSNTLTKTNGAGAVVTYSFSFDYDYALTCSAGSPLKMTADVAYLGSLDAPRMAVDASGAALLDVTSLDAAEDNYLVNGSFDRKGSFVSKVRNQNTSQSTIDLTLTNVAVDKTNRMITGGEASLTITGTVTGKGDFSFTGSIVFKGNKQADVTINGSKYSVNVETGDVTAL